MKLAWWINPLSVIGFAISFAVCSFVAGCAAAERAVEAWFAD